MASPSFYSPDSESLPNLIFCLALPTPQTAATLANFCFVLHNDFLNEVDNSKLDHHPTPAHDRLGTH